MELLKLDERPAEFPWKDVVIFYRKNVTVEDRFTVDTSGATVQKDKIQFGVWDFYKTMVKVFVTGWKGVTQDGKDVPYDFESLLKLPSSDSDDLIMTLGYKIAQETGFIKKDEETDLKNA